MSLSGYFTSSDLLVVSLILVAALLLAYIIPFFVDQYGLRGIPGPMSAKFSNLWLARLAFKGTNLTAVHKQHEKHGPLVRVAPNHVSIADPGALQPIYGAASRATKADLYDAFVLFGKKPSVFSTRSRAEHARKRRYLSHAMSMRSILEFEPGVRVHQHALVRRWDALCEAGAKGHGGEVGMCVWQAREGRVWFNCMQWYNFETFDIIADLAFGAPFGMLENARDTAPVVLSQKAAMAAFYNKESGELAETTVPAVKIINETLAFNTFLGLLPRQWRRTVLRIPSFQQDVQSRASLGTIAVTAVAKRLRAPVARNDFLSRLIAVRDADGQPLGAQELSSEAATLLNAGSDTTSNSLGAITFYLAQNQSAQAKLQAALDAALGAPAGAAADDADAVVAPFDCVKNVGYLQDCINEGLRLHATIGIDLPRVVPPEGLAVAGRCFPPGTVVGVPIFTLHRLKAVWGADADAFDPDRWERGDRSELMKAFTPFGIGPRACIGRNLAMMELTICIATVFHRYHFVLQNPDKPLDVHEGFLRKPNSVPVGMKRRV